MRTWKREREEQEDWRDIPGPWSEEPDKVQWVDEATGLDCLIIRNRMGALCGYVGVTEGHPFFGVEYMDVEPQPEVHGGLTFSDFCHEVDTSFEAWTAAATDKTYEEWVDQQHGLRICHVPEPGRPDKVWWLGFDCGHSMDIIPGFVALDREMGIKSFTGLGGETYKGINYVRNECRLLAQQLQQEATIQIVEIL